MEIFGIKTSINWTWWIFVLLILIPIAMINIYKLWLAIWFAFILMIVVIGHELAHALTARYFFGYNTRSITLSFLGGIALIEIKGGTLKPKEEFVTALAGPLFNIILAIPFFLLSFWLYPEIEGGLWLHSIWAINALMGVGNLIPAYPMDGGRILRATIAHFFFDDSLESFLKATKIAHMVTGIIALALVIFGIYINNIFLSAMGVVILYVAYRERQHIGRLTKK